MGLTRKLESKKWHARYYMPVPPTNCDKCGKQISQPVSSHLPTYYGLWLHYNDHGTICPNCYTAMIAEENSRRDTDPDLLDLHRVQKAVELRIKVEHNTYGSKIFARASISKEGMETLLTNVEYGMYLIAAWKIDGSGVSSIDGYESYRTTLWSIVARHYKPFIGRRLTIECLDRIYLRNRDMWKKKYHSRQVLKDYRGVMERQGERIYPSPESLAKIVTRKLAPSRVNSANQPEDAKDQGGVTIQFYGSKGRWHIKISHTEPGSW